jgi:sugar phosphate isomerase/epimerase
MTYRTRRSFLRDATAGAALTAFAGLPACAERDTPAVSEEGRGGGDEPWFRISLAEWSLHRTLGTDALDNLGFITAARRDFGIEAVEYVNSFFFERAEDIDYLKSMIERCDGEGVRSLLIMCDNEGRIGDPDETARRQAVENHYKWAEAAAFLGCHSIRVNAASEGNWAEQSRLAADGLNRLARYAGALELNVLVENHGGLSSNASWLVETIERADHPALGTLPDFGNFRIAEDDWYDIYQGVEQLMPLARAVSAKSHEFDADGNEADKDYARLLRIVRDAGYRGWVGIEYEGSDLPEEEGIRRTKALLERVRAELAP